MASRTTKEKVACAPWMVIIGDKRIEVTENMVPSWAVGFVYQIDNHAQFKSYIGRKLLTSIRRKKIGIRAKKISKTRKLYETTIKDSGWMQYQSSCKPLIAEMKEHPEWFSKHIIHWAHSKKHLSYLETKEQLCKGMLEKDSYVDNVAGRWFRKDLVKKE